MIVWHGITISSVWSYCEGHLGQHKLLSVTVLKPVHEIHNCVHDVNVCEGHTDHRAVVIRQLTDESQVQNTPVSVPGYLGPNRPVIQSAPTASISLPISLHLIRQSALLKSHFFIKSCRATFTSTFLPRESYTHPPSPFQCRLSFPFYCYCCYCCYCCPWLDALQDAPCAFFLARPVVRRLHLSFRSPVPDPFFRMVAVRVAQAVVAPNRCYCCFLLGDYSMLMAREALPLRPQGDVSCVEALAPLVPWRPERNDRGLAPVLRDLKWSSTRLFPCGNGTVLKDPPLVHDLLLRWHIQAVVCVAKLLKVSSAQRRSSHLSKFGHQWRQRNCRMWLQYRRSDPNSVTIVFQCIWY